MNMEMNKKIKRYRLRTIEGKLVNALYPCNGSEWVKWRDVKKLIALQKHFEESGKLDERDEKLYGSKKWFMLLRYILK